MYTTVRLKERTKNNLNKLKDNNESFDTLLNKLISLVPEEDDEGKYTDEFKASLLQGLYEAKMGKTISLKEFEKEMGL